MATPNGLAQSLPALGDPLTDEQVTAFARLAIDGLGTEYPNKPAHVMTGPESIVSPRELHPAFFGSYDWHSSVHAHWMLVRLLKQYPACSIGREIRSRLDQHFTAETLLAETRYFDERENHSFERMYGWAWFLRLAAELHNWDDKQGQQWRANLRPLEDRIVELTVEYLPRLSYPIRTGVHPDTAFALGQTWDYARIVGNPTLRELVAQRSRDYFGNDLNYNPSFEPSGEDFFSPSLNEADLMRRILPQEEFLDWLSRFLPTLLNGQALEVLRPVAVTDVTDGKLVHLAGLNLSRAWTLRGIGGIMDTGDPRRSRLESAAAAHADAGFRYVFSGHYEGEHWLATFAVYVLSDVGL